MEDFASKLRGLDFAFKKFMRLLQSDKTMAAMLKQRDGILNPEDDTLMLRAANEIESLRARVAELEAEAGKWRVLHKAVSVALEAAHNREARSARLEAQEASEPVACSRCGGSGIVPIGDGYSVDPCPVCKVMGVPRVLGHAGENDIGQLPPPVMGGSPLSQDGGKQTCAGTASHPVSQEASEPDQTVLHKLARRTLWIAYCWNDHNFEAAHKEARRTAEECGINSFDDANDWLKKLPKAPSTEKVSQEPDPHDDSALRAICLRVAEEVLNDVGWIPDHTNAEAIVDRVLGEKKCS